MWWFVFTSVAVNLIIIWFMPKHLTRKEIYVTWFMIVCINLSSDIILDLYLKLYQVNGIAIQLRVHLLEWTLGASYGIIYLNFMPQKTHKFMMYLVFWVACSTLFEVAAVRIHYINYQGWKLWYSTVFYLFMFLFLRWHIHFIRKTT